MPGARPLAHSAPRDGGEPQLYADHILGVTTSATSHAGRMIFYCRDQALRSTIVAAVQDASIFHDLGKLAPSTQAELRRGRGVRLTLDHVDAGVAHLWSSGAKAAAWMVRAHHSPGLPSRPLHFAHDGRRLRGRRHDSFPDEAHISQVEATDRCLADMVAAHEAELRSHIVSRGKAFDGLTLRLALSTIVDADHSDTARFDSGWRAPEPRAPRWQERLASLDAYVTRLGSRPGKRNALRKAFYEECRHRSPEASLIACEGPVGIGKTTAVLAYLLRRAMETDARRLFIVAPFTAILSQIAKVLREALLLSNERDLADEVIAEHHHRADFSGLAARDLATLWSAPIILTSSVQFFDTLSSNHPSALRKLHALPGSVVFLDEAHAAVPVAAKRHKPSSGESVETLLLRQHWRWVRQLADDWGCSFALGSGSLARFWELEDVVGERAMELPDLVPRAMAPSFVESESARLSYRTLGRIAGPAALARAVAETEGPRLVILNTVQSAAVMAAHMRKTAEESGPLEEWRLDKATVLHLSTALCPRDRDAVLDEVRRRLDPSNEHDRDWTLVATSLMEAGIDVSFRTAFRERFSVTSLIQIGGRVNRNFESAGGAIVYDFLIEAVDGLTRHPEATRSADIVAALFEEGAFDGDVDSARLVTLAMLRDVRGRRTLEDHLGKAEASGDFPDVASLGQLIAEDTALVVVDLALRDRLAARETVSGRDLLLGSVQLRSSRIDYFVLQAIANRGDEVFFWPFAYDGEFLGYMAGALTLAAVANGQIVLV